MAQDNNELLGKLLDKLDDMERMTVQITLMASNIATMQSTQDSILKAINGNGKPGLADRVRELEYNLDTHKATCPMAATVTELKAAHDKEESDRSIRDREWSKWKWGLLASILLLLASTALSLWTAGLK